MLDFSQVGCQVGVRLDQRLALILDALYPHRDGADLVIEPVQQVGGDIPDRREGFGGGALVFGQLERLKVGCVLDCQGGVMPEDADHAFIPIRLAEVT